MQDVLKYGDSTNGRSPESMSPLLSLPYELRLCIYKHIMPYDEVINIVSSHVYIGNDLTNSTGCVNIFPESQPEPGILTNLFLVCKQIQHEAYEMFYRSNQFVLTLGRRYRGGLRRYSPVTYIGRILQEMKKIKLEIIHHDWKIAFNRKGIRTELTRLVTALGTDNKLQILDVQIEIDDSGDDDEASQLFSSIDILGDTESQWDGCISKTQENLARGQFCLEPLASLRGLQKVTISGTVPKQFNDDLVATMTGVGA